MLRLSFVIAQLKCEAFVTPANPGTQSVPPKETSGFSLPSPLLKCNASTLSLYFLFFLKALETQLWMSAASWHRSTSAACKYTGHKVKPCQCCDYLTLFASHSSGSGCPPGTDWTSWGAELWARPCARPWPLTPSSQCWLRLTWRRSTDVCRES